MKKLLLSLVVGLLVLTMGCGSVRACSRTRCETKPQVTERAGSPFDDIILKLLDKKSEEPKPCSFRLEEVDSDSADELIACLKEHPEEVVLRINSPGGSVEDGLRIIDAIKAHGKVVCRVEWNAASMGAAILESCKERRISPGGVVMMHQVSVGGLMRGNRTHYRNLAERLAAFDEQIKHLYCHRAKDVAACKASIDDGKEAWLSAQQCLEWGLCDVIRS